MATAVGRRKGDTQHDVAPDSRRRARRARRLRQGGVALALVAPAAAAYLVFVLRPIALTIQYSLYKWNGIGASTWVGLSNYAALFKNPDLSGSIVHAFELILFFSIIPVALGLFTANTIRGFATSKLALVSRTVLFVPQIIPLVAAGIMWSWLLSSTGVVNQMLRLVGLGRLTRAWLGDFSTALPSVGVIGAWVLFGLCMLLLLAGMAKIDPALYEAARIDGAGPWREFLAITLPSLRQEIGVCLTVTVISRPGQLRHHLHLHPGRPRQHHAGARPGDLLPRLLPTAGGRWPPPSPSPSWCWCWSVVLPLQRITRDSDS